MGYVRNDNYYVVKGWMINELNLKGVDLSIYAILYGFTQDGENFYTGGADYLSKFACCDISTARRSLKRLAENGLILKEPYEINNVVFNRYKCLHPMQNTQGGVGAVPTNNKTNNNIKEISTISNDIVDIKKKRKKYGEYENVLLTEEEYNKFKAECRDADKLIERMSEYMAMKGVTYKNHLAALRNWHRRDKPGKEIKTDPFMEELKRIHDEAEAAENDLPL